MISILLRKKFLMSSALLFSVTFLSGCVYIVVGSLGALGGYVISPDTVQGVLDNRTYDEVWEASIEIVSLIGLVEEQSDAAGVILAKVQGAKVNINIFRLSQSAVRVTVKARKAFLPKIKVAQDVYVKIANYLEE